MATPTPSQGRPRRPARLLAATFAALLLLSALPLPAQAATAPLPPLGMSMDAADDLMGAGAKPRFGSYWVGPWTSTSGWSGVDNAMRTGKAMGVTPVLHWFYWGDSISPNCVEYGCDGRSRAQWYAMTDTLASHIRTEMGGREVIVVLENEFNKGGIAGSYSPTFDAHLENIARKLDAVPGVKLVAGFGSWGEQEWHRFPKTIAMSDYVGFQMMRASTKDTEAQYRAAADRIVYLTDFVSSKFQKPSFLYDLALSSYPDAHWERVQAETLSRVFDKLSLTGGSTGLQGVVYRTLVDNPHMGLHNYYGYAERHWGLKKAWDGGDKPSWAVWKAKATSGGDGSDAPFEATFMDVKVDEWWVQTKVYANQVVAKVEVRVDGGAWSDLPKQSWGGAYAKSIHVKWGQCIQLRASASDGSSTTSSAYGRGGGACTTWGGADGGGSTDASTGAFSATHSGVKVDEWWVQTSVSATRTVSKVEARVDGGAWSELPRQSWGAYAKSIHVKWGQCVEFRTTATDGSLHVSSPYGRGGGACTSSGATASFSATYTGLKVDEWWVQASVSGTKAIAKVEARVVGGAWTELPKQSWGAYAKSLNVKWGQCVEFRATATDGSTHTSAAYARGGGACGFDATFSGMKVQEWWVQVSVSGDKPVSKVEARVDGGAWTHLPKQTWGAYAKSMHVKWGQSVEFRATASDGTTDTSVKYWR